MLIRKWSLAKSPEQTSDLMSRLKFASLKFGNQPFSPRKETVGSPHELRHLYQQQWLTLSRLSSDQGLTRDQVPGGQVYLRPSSSHTEQPMTVTVNRADCLVVHRCVCVCAQAHVHVDVCMWRQVPKENQHTTSPAAGVTSMPDRSAEIQT